MKLKERFGGTIKWEGGTCDLLMNRLNEINVTSETQELARIVAEILDRLPITDAERVEIIGSYRWELDE